MYQVAFEVIDGSKTDLFFEKLFKQHVGEDFDYAAKSREAQSFDRLREYSQRLQPGN